MDQIFHTNSGRGMLVENNLFIGADRGLSFNVWGEEQKFLPGGNWQMVERIEKMKYDQPPYSARYPMLARLAEDFALGEEEWLQRALPKENVIRRNVSFGKSFFVRLGAQAGLDAVRIEKNLICDPVAFSGSPTGDGQWKSYRSEDAETRELMAESGNILAPSVRAGGFPRPPEVVPFRPCRRVS